MTWHQTSAFGNHVTSRSLWYSYQCTHIDIRLGLQNITHYKSLFRFYFSRSVLPFNRPYSTMTWRISWFLRLFRLFQLLLTMCVFSGRCFYFLSFTMIVSTSHVVWCFSRFHISRMDFSSESVRWSRRFVVVVALHTLPRERWSSTNVV